MINSLKDSYKVVNGIVEESQNEKVQNMLDGFIKQFYKE